VQHLEDVDGSSVDPGQIGVLTTLQIARILRSPSTQPSGQPIPTSDSVSGLSVSMTSPNALTTRTAYRDREDHRFAESQFSRTRSALVVSLPVFARLRTNVTSYEFELDSIYPRHFVGSVGFWGLRVASEQGRYVGPAPLLGCRPPGKPPLPPICFVMLTTSHTDSL
jgi:hypothetical protein